MKKRVLSLVLTFVMLVGLFPATALAEEPAGPDVVYGSYNEDGEWVESTGADGTYEDEATGVTLSKQAEPTGDPNTYEITLTVQTSTTTSTTPPGAAATVLVIDVSGSMDFCANCGGEYWHAADCVHHSDDWRNNGVTDEQSRMAAAKKAAISFLDSYKGDTPGTGRYVAVVSFSDNATTKQNWVDVSTEAGYAAAESAINGLSAKGGTNLDAGLASADRLLSGTAVGNISAAQKNVVALTDGVPTYSQSHGTGQNCNETILRETAATASTLKESAQGGLYTVCFGASEDSCYRNGPTVGAFLRDSVATEAYADAEGEEHTFAYDATDTDELNAAFKAITESITTGITGAGLKVTDPMADGVTAAIPSDESVEKTADGFNWDLSKATPETRVEGDTTYYTYTLTYTVTLDPTEIDGFEEGKYYPLNAPTTLTIPGEEDITIDFPVPGVQSTLPTYTVTYAPGEHGTLSGADESGNVVHENLKHGTKTPAAPAVAVTDEDNYYFSGWSPEIAEKVTEDVTYVAQYAAKTLSATITGGSDAKTYNGAEQTVNTYQHTLSEDGYTLDTGALRYSASGTEVGDHPGSFSGPVRITDSNGVDVTYMFRITMTTGTLTITPRSITIKADDDTKTYDGSALTKDSYEITSGTLAGGQRIDSVTVTGSRTEAGSSANVPSAAKIVDAQGTDVTSNYSITYVNGTLTVNADTSASISATGYTGTYDGQSHEGVTGITLKDGKGNEIPREGWTITYNGQSTMPQYQDAGTYTVEVKASNPNYCDVTATVTVVISPKPVTFTSPDKTQEYNGQALVGDSREFTADGLVPGETVTYENLASITDVGSTTNTIQVVWGGVNASNYAVTKNEGTLTITKNTNTDQSVSLTATAYSGTYDGQSHPLITDKSVTGDVKGNTWTYTYSTDGTTYSTEMPRRTIAGTYPVWVKASCGNYEDLVVEVNAEISPKPVTLTSGSQSWSYDGDAHSIEEVTTDGFVGNDGATFSSFASITNVSDSPKKNTFEYTLNPGTVAGNYAITQVYGELKITPSENASLTVNGYTGTYDGRPHEVTASVADYAEGNEWTLTYSTDGTAYSSEMPTRTDAGTTTVYVKAESPNYKTLTAQADIQIAKRAVTLTSASHTKSYDGTPLTDPTVTVSGMGFVDGEGAEYHVTGSQTVVGDSENSFTYTLNSGTKAANYEITKVLGTLKVTTYDGEQSLVATPYTQMYDGGSHDAVTSYTVSGVDIEGVEWTYEFSTDDGSNYSTEVPQCTNAGQYPIVVKASAPNFKPVTAEVTAEVTQRHVTLTSGTSEKTYDGNALENHSVVVTGDGFATGEGADYNVTGSRTDAGESENTFTYALWDGTAEGKKETKAANYVITTVAGTLTVKKNGTVDVEDGVRLTATGYKGTYDGAAHVGVSNETVTGDVKGNVWAYTYSTNGENYDAERPEFKDAGTYTVHVKATTNNYEDLHTTVTVEITPAVITVTADNKSKLVGEADPALTYQATTPVASETPAFTGELTRVEGETRGAHEIQQGTLALINGEGFKASNYTLSFVPGTLTILLKELTVTKTVSSKSAEVGDRLTYTITVKNTGDVNLTGIKVKDQMLGVDKAIGNLAAGESWTDSFTYTAKSSDAGKTIINTAIAKADDGTTGEGSSDGTKITRPRDDDKDDDRPPKLNTDDHYSYIIGYKDGTLRPYGTITRGEVATIFFRLLTDEARDEYWDQDSGYSDCGPDLWCNNAISTLSNMGIIDGFQDGTFRPYAKITRAQFAKIAVGFFETTTRKYQGYYSDVPENAWFTDYVEAASRVGLIQGFEDGTFRPNVNITRAQACVIVNRALNRKPDEDHLLPERKMLTWPDNNPGDWFYADMQEATNSHDYTWLSKGSEKKYMEEWTKKLEQRDWAAFEHAWSTAHSAPGGEVAK